MELSEALNNRKSTRHYIDKKVDKSLLDEMLSAANLAPSWKNSQTPRFYVATGEKSKNAVREALQIGGRFQTSLGGICHFGSPNLTEKIQKMCPHIS